MQREIAPHAVINSDEAAAYKNIGPLFASHEAVNHSQGEYVRGDAHVNTAESVHSLVKRGVFGTYHHWSVTHLHRYLTEFDFRFNLRKTNDGLRVVMTIKGAGGKRLYYKQPRGK